MPGIYIHIPFCRKRCNYCDFYFITNTNLTDSYISSLKKEIILQSDKFKNQTFETVYFGGGTPSILTSEQISDLLNLLHKNFSINSSTEISIEANPEDYTDNKFRDYASAGINRVSFGVQSFIDSELNFLTRQHSSDKALSVISSAVKFFGNINLDIIYSLPGQKQTDLEYSLDTAVKSGTVHISAYTLTYEEKTVLYKMLKENKFQKNPDDEEGKLYRFVSEKLKSEGFGHYEVSNFARTGFECRHNLKYWNYENYLGFGPSSHSLFFNRRWNNVKSISMYEEMLNKNLLPAENEFMLSDLQRKFEYIMLSLRSGGIDFQKYEELFGENFLSEYSSSVKELTSKNYSVLSENNFRLNLNGYCVADEIISRYF